jgi:hypothetical protein
MPKGARDLSMSRAFFFVHCVGIVFGHPTFVRFQRFYPGSKRMSITPEFNSSYIVHWLGCHPMAGFAYYTTIKRNRAERKRLHEEERAKIY